VDFQLDPRCRDAFAEADWGVAWGRVAGHSTGVGRKGAATFNDDPRAEALQSFFVDDSFHLHYVSAWVGMAWVEEAGIEAGLIREQEQSFRIPIKPPERIHVRGQSAFRERALPGMVRGELRKDAERFVEGEEQAGGISGRAQSNSIAGFSMKPRSVFMYSAATAPSMTRWSPLAEMTRR
jgi:hypothetical protein